MVENLVTDESKQRYIKEVIEHLESLKQQMMLFASFDVALLALTLSNLVFNGEFVLALTVAQKYTLGISVIFVFLSSGLYAAWASLIQSLRTQAIDWMITLDVEEARRVHYPGRSFYKRRGWISLLAIIFMFLGIFGYLVFVFLLLFQI